MPTKIITGNIFTTNCDVIVNTVNCVGVMGAGIALECRLRYPDMYVKYKSLCKRNLIEVGKLWLYKSDEKWILNFPTKRDWKFPSKAEFIHKGLQKFIEVYEQKDIQSIAFPMLGADKGGIKVGVFGIGIELEGLVSKNMYGNTLYQNPIEKSNYYAELLKNSLDCDIVICLSHLGFKYNTKKMSDKLLASQTKNIDLIIGGHTHTFLNKPIIVENLESENVQIAQVGYAGINIGRIDYFFNQKMCVKKVNGCLLYTSPSPRDS